MTKREYQRLLRRAAVAYNLNDDYDRVMDEATRLIPTGEDEDSDNAWEKFCADLDEAIKIPPTERQRSSYARRQKQKEIEDAKMNLRNAQQRLTTALL